MIFMMKFRKYNRRGHSKYVAKTYNFELILALMLLTNPGVCILYHPEEGF